MQEAFGQEIRPLIVPIDKDLHSLQALSDIAKVQNGGLLCFILGSTGVGKTTAIHSAAVHMPETFAPVVKVPPEIRFRDVTDWLSANLAGPEGHRSTLVLFDGRELSDDDVGIRQLLSALNQLLRRRPDVLFCWPTTDKDWHTSLRNTAETVGGANFVPKESDLFVSGPPEGEWPTVLERLLLQFGKTYDDVGIAQDVVGRFCAESKTIGDFLTQVGRVIAERITKTRYIKRLPQIVFVVTSSGDVVGEANRIRRAGTQSLAPEPLLGYSPRSEAGKWWNERNRTSDHHLGYIISLFDARLVTMTASAMVYSCLHSGTPDLEKAATDQGARADKGNARRIIEASEIYRFLKGEQIPEFTTGKKGGHQESTAKAYAAAQAMSAKRHKAINQALCRLTKSYLPDMAYDEERHFEVSHGGNLITDAMIQYAGRPYSLEFHHLSEAQCAAAGMASYIMEKLRTYSWHHQLIPR
ncbi:ATP-binding protein [Xanthomonas sacchari]|uniref:ATP-binding protein n=1 Tax=Xanthomonas sacchari TaxID=56458 RepID=UPI002255D120|nr:ATP-binding protein [Xanthomonas sacchari]